MNECVQRGRGAARAHPNGERFGNCGASLRQVCPTMELGRLHVHSSPLVKVHILSDEN